MKRPFVMFFEATAEQADLVYQILAVMGGGCHMKAITKDDDKYISAKVELMRSKL